MRFVNIQRDSYAEPGVQVEDTILGLRGAGFHNLISVMTGGTDAADGIARWIETHPFSEEVEVADARLLAPIARPPKIICVGLNYRDHAAESGLALPEVPTIFAKFPTAVIGPGQAIVLPKHSTRPDYEAELCVVIGKGGRNIPAGRWQEHVFGYTILNDVSARDYQMATSQWMIGKTFDTFAPVGPAIVTADEIPDPHNLHISLELNGQVMQDSNTSNLIFKIPQLIEYLSSVFTLETGDLIATGTPAGVGFARKPPVYLKAGDEVRIQIEGIGELANPVTLEA
ncbi:MAG TPA: fumarylacetoacetate hydrolase family protein [Bryobacteraceae bacterium]|nr:fumarylacetoacetate hydrolase family protein [Bryobacteraceae bacterium]